MKEKLRGIQQTFFIPWYKMHLKLLVYLINKTRFILFKYTYLTQATKGN